MTIPLDSAWTTLLDATLTPEAAAVASLHARITIAPAANARIDTLALALANKVRTDHSAEFGAEAFLQAYSLSTREGVALMCLAEALLRIPDERTADELIRDKLSGPDWVEHVSGGGFLTNAAAWGLMLTGRLVGWRDEAEAEPKQVVHRMLARLGEPVARTALKQAMRIMARQFVIAESIEQALERARASEGAGYRYSFDMLGEAARTREDAARYFERYAHAIKALGTARESRDIHASDGISVKLSALHPRYEVTQKPRVMSELMERLVALAAMARDAGIGFTVDAEEAERLTLSLELFAALARLPQLQDWGGLGLAVQAYQRRGVYVIDWLVELAAATRQRFMVRLVKGAYWDSEIKWAQQRGLDDYPVFTRKAATDLSYIACAARLLSAPAQIYPQFATHNSRTLATVLELAGGTRDFEFQKLQGMGDALYRHVLADNPDIACRVYAPVGGYRDLLAYLVRRMLENGANSSFVHQIADPAVPVQRLIVDPLKAMALPYRPNARLKLPRELYPDRLNSRGLDLADERVLDSVAAALAAARASSMPDAKGERLLTIREPANLDIVVGSVIEADASAVSAAIEVAAAAFPSWERTPAHERSACLERAAELMEQRMLALITLCMREAGKTVADALAEVREAIDYCRYYAVQGRAQFGTALALPGPTGEANELRLHGRGVFACISPWNFPLAIFTGQVTAALMAGNAVVAKPAEQTPLIAQEAVAILHEAGVPRQALQLVLGSGEAIGPALTADQRIAGVAFTGSIATATAINRTLAQRGGPIVPLIAETGGQNAMLVDSSALIEQAVADIVTSAFQSAGQRCSSLRLLFVQEEIAGSLIDMLRGAMLELSVGDPCVLQTDIGPIIDAGAKQALDEYVTQLRTRAKLIAQAPLPASSAKGHFVAPVALEIAIADIPDHEVFGPVLHVLRYRAEDIEQVFDAIRRTRCGLTLGIQSRIERFVERVCASVGAGNTYVNRNMIGAVVGVQPFGGEGLSGTGPKAGGPHYLARFALERTLSVNTAAVGGNAHLLADSD